MSQHLHTDKSPSPGSDLFAQHECCSCKPAPPQLDFAETTCCGKPAAEGKSVSRWQAFEEKTGKWGVVACGLLAIAAWATTHLTTSPHIPRAIYAFSIALGGWPLLRGAIMALRNLSLEMKVLMSVAAIGACILGDWGEAASLVFLYSVSEWVEEASIFRSRHAITRLMGLAPPRALARRGSELVDVDAGDVAIGDKFVVRAGERIALDGIVAEGISEVDQAPVTGESAPVEKRVGAEVFAGTLNGSGVLEIRATRPAHEGTVARIARLVAQTEREKSPRQRLMERFASRYTPAVMAVAFAAALAPPLLFKTAWPDSILRALALLVAACPCAFVLSGPVATICALSAAARNGVLIRGGGVLEDLANVKAVAFDKTGTLTRGVPQVTDFSVLNGMPVDRALAVAAALERRSTHPLAQALVAYADERGRMVPTADQVGEIGGQGVSGWVDGVRYRLGPTRVFAREGIFNGRAERVVERLQKEGRSVALLCSDEAPLAAIGFNDTIRPEAKLALAKLKEQGIYTHIVLSGDHAAVVRAIAHEVGADIWHGGLLPEDKLKRIHELSAQHGMVAMVGDGINDAPALAAAGIGVAMGVAGSDAALEVADVALMGDDLMKLPEAVALSRKARRVIVQNIVVAFAMKLIFVAGLFIGVWGTYALIGGVVADVGATLLVTANGLRLLRGTKPA